MTKFEMMNVWQNEALGSLKTDQFNWKQFGKHIIIYYAGSNFQWGPVILDICHRVPTLNYPSIEGLISW